MSVLDNIMVGRHHLMRNNFVTGMLYWVGGAQREEQEHRRKVEDIIDFLEIQHVRNEPAGTLPYGLRKRVELARAIAIEPELILLDEPMAGMNLEEKEDMARYVVDLNQELGKTVIMIEHDMGVVMDISHRVMVLDFGRKIREGTPEEVLANEHVRRAYLGEGDAPLHESGARGPMMDVRTEIVQVHGSTCGWPSTSSVPAEVALHDTLPRMLARNARQSPDLVAQREKEFGIWTAYTWRSVEHHVRRMSTRSCRAWVSRPGDVVVLIGDNRPAWVWGEIAAHACGARSLGIYRDALEDEIAYLVDYTSPKVVIAEDEEQVDKFLSLAGRIPSVERIIYLDPRGMRKYDDPRLMFVADLEASGQVALDSDPGCYERMVAATRADDVAILCTTSGTTSHPKLAEWTHRAFLGHAASYLVADPKGSGRRVCRGAAAVLGHGADVLGRLEPDRADEGELPGGTGDGHGRSARDRADVPAACAARVGADRGRRARPDDGLRAPGNRRSTNGESCAGSKPSTRASAPGSPTSCCFRHCATGWVSRISPPPPPAAPRWGPIRSSSSSPCGFRCASSTARPRRSARIPSTAQTTSIIETVGYPMPGVEIAIKDPDQEGLGEIIVRHPHMMTAYYKNPDASAEMFDDAGWFLTGDAGYLTPGVTSSLSIAPRIWRSRRQACVSRRNISRTSSSSRPSSPRPSSSAPVGPT